MSSGSERVSGVCAGPDTSHVTSAAATSPAPTSGGAAGTAVMADGGVVGAPMAPVWQGCVGAVSW